MSAVRSSMVVALTGGVAAGKSAVAKCFERFGVHVYDADVAARAVVEPETDGLASVVAAFGTGILDASGRIDRPAMRRRVFAAPESRTLLESILHPLVRRWLVDHAETDAGPYCLLVIPLLAENIEHYRWIDRILLVDAAESVQLERLIARDGIDEVLARRMLEQQASRANRLALADDVIDNSASEAALDEAVAILHQHYLRLAAQRRP